LFHVAETFENARNCWRNAAGDSRVAVRDDNGLAVRDVKVRHDAEGAIERYWLVRVGARRANREQRAMFAGSYAAMKLDNAVRLGLLGLNAQEERRSRFIKRN
jgi:hypothetical protein